MKPIYQQIAVINTKGGVGKTTLAMMFAHVLSEAGKQVIVHDTDADGSAYAWAQYAEQEGTPLPFSVVDNAGLARVMTPDLDYLIVDTPANNLPQISRLVEVSEYLIIPVQPGALELDRLQLTWQMIKNHPKRPKKQLVGFVLNSKTHTNLSRDTEGALAGFDPDYPIPVIGTMGRKVGYQQCFGTKMGRNLTQPAAEMLQHFGLLEDTQ